MVADLRLELLVVVDLDQVLDTGHESRDHVCFQYLGCLLADDNLSPELLRGHDVSR